MIEIIIDKEEEKKTIGVIENGKLIEVYEENKENKHERNEGNIYVGIVKDIIPGMQAAFIDIGTEKNSFIHVRDIMPQIDEKIERKEEKKIKDLVKPKQKLLVQVQKDSNDKKGARTTTHIKLTGKYVILLPQTTIVTVSQKIQDETEKNRLIKLVKENLQENMGAIIRTGAEKKENEIIIEDLQKLQEQWQDIYQKFKKSDSKSQLLYTSPSIVEKIILDLPSEKIDSIIVNTKEDYSELEQVVSHKIKLALEENKNLIKKYELENQIEKAKQRKVWLNCGGFITIDKTEALTAIDINSGKFTGKKNSSKENTIYKVNQEATVEIAKQLRLRNISGIIVIDYIDMEEEQDRKNIMNLLEKELKKDRSKTQIMGFTKLDLLEMTRKKL